jgi:predicted nucleic acid-binding protein
MKLVVSDASPINYLILIGAEHILPRMFSKIILPRLVCESELQHPDAPPAVRSWALNLPSWAEVRDPAAIPLLELDPGETHAIALALECKCPVLLDERQARKIAVSQGLQILGTIGLLEEASSRGLIQLPEALERLSHTNARISGAIIREALARYHLRQ